MPPPLYRYGGLAHLVERSVRNRQAGGSKPPSSTVFFFVHTQRGDPQEDRTSAFLFCWTFCLLGMDRASQFPPILYSCNIFLVCLCVFRQRVRVVKELVLKANGLFPREFKSRRCRSFLFVFLQCNFLFWKTHKKKEEKRKKKKKKEKKRKKKKKQVILRSRELNPGLPRDRREY